MRVDRIEPFDKRRSRIFLDGEFAFTLYHGEMRRYQIEEGGELGEEQYQEILQEIVFKRARERAVYLLKSSGRTEEELRRKLKMGGYPPGAVDDAVNLMKRYGYVDDQEYVRNYLELHGKKKSRAELISALRQKGISKEEICRHLEENPVDEEEKIRFLLRKRRFDPETALPEERRKQASYLMRKGFSWTAVRQVILSLEEGE